MAETVRFTAVVAACGAPEVYLPLANPRGDRPFMRAVKEMRVLTLKQTPTGNRKDFGTIGFVEERYVTYLLFPKSLREFSGKRVVGIRYDDLQKAGTATPAGRTATTARSPTGRRRPRPRAPTRGRLVPDPPKPKKFHVRARIVVRSDRDLTVEALSKREARHKAEDLARAQADLNGAKRTITITSLEESR